MDLLTIPEWFAGKNIFITGGSGFIGRVLIEKLLRSCPDIGTIYMLLRSRKGKNPKTRMAELFNVVLFDDLKRKNPKALSKLVLIEGDIAELGLGISAEDRKTLIENVNVIFHSAASVRFDDPLKYAIFINTRGTREVINLGLEMKNLKVLVHVSTTFCNCDRKEVDEIIYPAKADWRDAIRIAEEVDSHILDIFTRKYIEQLPNTYTFAKQLSEQVVNDLCDGKIPTVIIRPSIVISTAVDPIKGWIDNVNGPVGILTAIGKGILRVVFTDYSVTQDYMMVDYLVRQIIVSCWKKGTESDKINEKSLVVYNASNNNLNALTNGEYLRIGLASNANIPFENILWYPKVSFTTWETYYYLQVMFRHVVPALFFDTLLWLFNKKPRLLKIQRRIYTASMAVNFFMTNTWKFRNDKLFAIQLHPKDIKDFEYVEGVKNIDMVEYFHYASKGVRQYLLKEDPSTLPQAKVAFRRMWLLDKAVFVLQYLLLIWLLFWKFDIIGYMQTRTSEYFSDW